MTPWNKGLSYTPKNAEIGKFKKGIIPAITHEVGYESLDSKGRHIIKIAHPRTWRLKHHILYEWYTGETLTKTDLVIFVDLNQSNFAPSNLSKVNRSELAMLCKMKYNEYPVELRHTLIAYVRLKLLIASLENAKTCEKVNRI